MTALASLVRLGDLDLLIHEASDPPSRVRLRKLGFKLDGLAGLESARARLAATIGERWMAVYERARKRYGVGVAVVRERVCQGCFVTLPTALVPRPEGADSPGLCQCCGRVLYWG
jgi:predicted  nucleic acid-binding Zn-ribbon protein